MIKFIQQLFFNTKTRRVRSSINEQSHESTIILKENWDQLINEYFPDQTELKNYQVVWSSRRQKRTLASCNIKRRKVTVARELRHEKASEWIEAILYHELCHAALDTKVSRRGRKMAWHGPEFKALVNRHPSTQALDTWIRSGGWRHVVRSDRARSINRKGY